jgi:hypothetical protein
MLYQVWVDQSVDRARVVQVEATNPQHAQELALWIAQHLAAWTEHEVVRQAIEVRPVEEA